MEIHDSVLIDLQVGKANRGHVLFHACIHRADGAIFDGAGHQCGRQTLRFDFTDMRIEGEIRLADEPYASHGDLWINAKSGNGIVYLPANHRGDICLELCLSPDFGITKIHASEVTSLLIGEFELEAIWNTDGTRTRA